MDQPAKFGRYEVLERVGRGGMGMVYRGRDSVLEREVAIKVMSGDFSVDETARTRFYREARAAAKLQHRNIVTIFEFGEEDGNPYIVMEFLRGVDLARRVRQEPPLTLDQKLEIMAELCTALHFAHEQGVVHRDVKPANIWLMPDGSVKLLDFGIAKVASSTVTSQGAVFGSASYMAPEQVTGAAVDARSDLFSVGVVLYELLAGRKPFEADSPTAILVKIMEAEPAALDQIVPDLPPPLITAVNRALQKDPARRYQRAADLAADLRIIRSGAHALTVQPPAPAVSPADGDTYFRARSATSDHAEPMAANVTLEREAHTPARRSRTRWWGSVLAVVAMGAVATIVLLTFRAPSDGPPGAAATAPGGGPAASNPRSPGATTPGPAAAASAALRTSTVRITSVPAGAGIVIDGRDTGQVTPAEIQLAEGPPPRQVRLTRRGAPPHDIVVTPELIAGGEIAATLPPLAEPAPAQTRVAVTSSYPVEIVDGERVLSPAGESHELTIAGRRTLRMRALDYYLDRPIQVDGSGRPIEVMAPGLGRLTVRSPLETCPVALDGHSLGFPPITNIVVAAGTYRLELSCPDGGSRQATITVRPGEPLLQIIR